MAAHSALMCKTCSLGLGLPGVPPVVDEDLVTFARRIAQLRPDLLSLVSEFCSAHEGHEWDVASIEPIEEWRKRS